MKNIESNVVYLSPDMRAYVAARAADLNSRKPRRLSTWLWFRFCAGRLFLSLGLRIMPFGVGAYTHYNEHFAQEPDWDV